MKMWALLGILTYEHLKDMTMAAPLIVRVVLLIDALSRFTDTRCVGVIRLARCAIKQERMST